MPSGVYKRTPETCAILSKARRNSDAVKAHNESMRGVPRQPEVCTLISKAHTGVPLSPEHCLAISRGTISVPKPPRTPEHCAAISKVHTGVPLPRTSEAQLAADEAQRGGNDLVNHHYIYDHNDLSKYTMKVTRSKHAKIHAWMRKAGIEVSHINENKQENA